MNLVFFIEGKLPSEYSLCKITNMKLARAESFSWKWNEDCFGFSKLKISDVEMKWGSASIMNRTKSSFWFWGQVLLLSKRMWAVSREYRKFLISFLVSFSSKVSWSLHARTSFEI